MEVLFFDRDRFIDDYDSYKNGSKRISPVDKSFNEYFYKKECELDIIERVYLGNAFFIKVRYSDGKMDYLYEYRLPSYVDGEFKLSDDINGNFSYRSISERNKFCVKFDGKSAVPCREWNIELLRDLKLDDII